MAAPPRRRRGPPALEAIGAGCRDFASEVGGELSFIISNIHARDELHRHSKIPTAEISVICGLGPHSHFVAQRLGTLPARPAARCADQGIAPKMIRCAVVHNGMLRVGLLSPRPAQEQTVKPPLSPKDLRI